MTCGLRQSLEGLCTITRPGNKLVSLVLAKLVAVTLHEQSVPASHELLLLQSQLHVHQRTRLAIKSQLASQLDSQSSEIISENYFTQALATGSSTIFNWQGGRRLSEISRVVKRGFHFTV